ANGIERDGKEAAKPSLLILNQPVPSWDVFERLWQHCGYRLCADGGANRLFDNFADGDGRREGFIPDIIHGDLDSLRDDVRAYYQSKGVTISRDPDQYSTDFGKAIKKIAAATNKDGNDGYDDSKNSTNGNANSSSNSSTSEIIILGTLAGRVDQGLGLLYEMYRESNKHCAPHLWLFSESSVSWILPPGRHRIFTPIQSEEEAGKSNDGAACFTKMIGILPAFGPAVISTEGLEWDVREWETSVGGQVSTSNHVRGQSVVVETDGKVLFTIERA
ncbi:thiamine pyrophosphokinase, partial [Saccharata proteae CBS 121410]